MLPRFNLRATINFAKTIQAKSGPVNLWSKIILLNTILRLAILDQLDDFSSQTDITYHFLEQEIGVTCYSKVSRPKAEEADEVFVMLIQFGPLDLRGFKG